jgi:endoglucanase
MNRNCTKDVSLYRTALWVFLSCCLLWTATPAKAQGAGYWHTSGNQILDSNNQPVRLAGVNWYGFETPDRIIHGLWAQDYKVILNTIKSNGYNVIRIPYSSEMVETNPVPTNFSVFNTGPINTDLQGLTALQILDKIVSFAGSIGLRVILDHHRSEAGSSAEGNGLWFTSTFSDSAWINDWVALTNRYMNNTTVIGMDLHNEPHNATSGGACWGCGSTTNDWRLAAQRAGNAVLAINPHLLIFVEGTDCFNGDCDWWGGNLEGVSQFPVTLSVPNQLVYSAHDYGPSLASQPWFNGSSTTATLQAHFSKDWGFIYDSNIAPVWVGEFGAGNNATDVQSTAAGSEGQWFSSLVQFMSARPAMNWTYWALNGEDSFSLLDSNYDSAPVSSAKQQLLASIQFPLGGSVGSTTPTISAINPASALPGASVTITGTNFSATANANTVTFGSAGATVTAATTTSLKVTVPNIAAGAVNVTVSVAGKSSNAVGFTVNSSTSSTPTISAINPTSALAGASVTITGTNFSATTNANTVTFGATTATVTAASTTSLTVTVPNIAAGAVNVTVSVAGKTSNAVGFTVNANTGGSGCHITYAITNSWSTGFQVAITIANTGTTAINNWSLAWTFLGNQQISNLWNGGLTQTGASVTVTSLNYNGNIPAGGNYNAMGFVANGPAATPASFSLNGTHCQ